MEFIYIWGIVYNSLKLLIQMISKQDNNKGESNDKEFNS